MIEVLTTERLSLRPRIVEDLAENLAMDLDPRVHRYIFSEAPDPEAVMSRYSGEHLTQLRGSSN
jgi:RimJ/RimL family protein N-acetyltransferase